MDPFGIPGDAMEQVLSLQTLGGDAVAAYDVYTRGCKLTTYHTASCKTDGCITRGCSTSICDTNTCDYQPVSSDGDVIGFESDIW